MRQSPSGPVKIWSVDVEFPIISWSGDENPPIPAGKIGEGQTTKSSGVVVAGITEKDSVLATLTPGNNIIFTFGLPFSFGWCMIEDTPVMTPVGVGRRVWLGVSYLQDLAPGESFDTNTPIACKLTFFRPTDRLRSFPS